MRQDDRAEFISASFTLYCKNDIISVSNEKRRGSYGNRIRTDSH